jgi:hypothetical protein
MPATGFRSGATVRFERRGAQKWLTLSAPEAIADKRFEWRQVL